jgi:3-hydroxybutyryl-CoA dehydrogenase
MITLQTGIGPCGMMDRMGLGVVHHVAQLLDEAASKDHAGAYARYIEEQFLRQGHLGVTTGQGFYRYPDPAFTQPGFI